MELVNNEMADMAEMAIFMPLSAASIQYGSATLFFVG